MQFKVGNEIHNLGFLTGLMDEEWKLRYTPEEGLVFLTLDEVDVVGAHGEPTGEKAWVWQVAFTVATGKVAEQLWEVLRRVVVAEKLCLDVDGFLEHVAAHDKAVETGRRVAIERQRIQVMVQQEELERSEGMGLAALRANQGPQRVAQPTKTPLVFPPFGGDGKMN